MDLYPLRPSLFERVPPFINFVPALAPGVVPGMEPATQSLLVYGPQYWDRHEWDQVGQIDCCEDDDFLEVILSSGSLVEDSHGHGKVDQLVGRGGGKEQGQVQGQEECKYQYHIIKFCFTCQRK